MSAPPLPFAFDGEQNMVCLRPKLVAQHYGAGEVVMMVPHEERSSATHGHQFAWLKDAWLNLPESIADNFPTPKHLRKRALIEAGVYSETIIDAGTNAAALRVASYVRSRDQFAVVVVRGPLVVERVANSQAHRVMNKAEFQASKQKVLEIVSEMIGVEPQALTRTMETA